jgi:hypothetical protein
MQGIAVASACSDEVESPWSCGGRGMDGEAAAESDRSIVGNPMLLPFYDLSFEEIELLCRVTAERPDGSCGSQDGAWFATFMDARKEPVR